MGRIRSAVSDKPTAHVGGYGFSMGRRGLLEILAGRATDLGVDIRYETEVTEESALPDADLIVACDGARSRLRDRHTEHFGTRIDIGRNKYIWLGTPHVFDTFTFGFERTEAGWIWFHAYPFTDDTSTFIVECLPATWAALGLDRADAEEGCARLADIFAKHLDGQPLVDDRATVGNTGWLNFRRITNERWHHGNVALMGDAAHTTHFAIGSGTKLAMQDAIALSEALATGDPLPAALDAYEHRRETALAPLQRRRRPAANGSSGCRSMSTSRRLSSRSRCSTGAANSRLGGTCCTSPRSPGRCGPGCAGRSPHGNGREDDGGWPLSLADPVKIAHNWTMTGRRRDR
jgi:anthraniloyl-CoA monooxygenase